MSSADPSKPQSAPAPAEPATRLDRIVLWIAVTLFVSFPVLLVFLLWALSFLFSVIAGQEGPKGVQPDRTAEKMALAASVQVAIGMVMGFVSVFMGLMMTWFGITAAFEFSGKAGEKAEASLKSASPGLLFFLGGIILIGVSLYKPIEFQERGQPGSMPIGIQSHLPPGWPNLNHAEKPK